MKKLRAAVFARAAGACECGCGTPLGDSGHLDHYFGRKHVAEAVENCWALALKCDDAKTNSRPSKAVWCRRFIAHAMRHGYAKEAERARMQIEVLRAKGLAS